MAGCKPALAIPKEQDIQHFTTAEWVDLVRGLVDGARSIEMRDHAAACTACSELAAYCSKLAQLSDGMKTAEPPDEIVQRAYAIFNGSGQ